MKDLFSTGSRLYQQARPSYPLAVLEAILPYVPEQQLAWDCAAGSGQFTQLLAPYFEHVVATDLSSQQLEQAPRLENVSYQVQLAEKTSFFMQSFDLITVAQAIHWFDFEGFYREVHRCLKPNGVLAVIGYGVLELSNTELNQLVQELYTQKLKMYWDAERQYIDASYKTIPFPFDEIVMPDLSMCYSWSGEQLLNYLSTWSALKHYVIKNKQDPLQEIRAYVERQQDVTFDLCFPIFMRVGRLK
ncbi:class I SAM-dependent methyltransferase [Acinetobacter rudis]|uniref:Class I SAM-dependent methyltransferase n=1 Tax=Acinetobacter rudis TaxID=632955 RepID=A0AAW8JC97_9GAMM|nr:class I SAM-dependent methyltransferase [Acinetobacter rudis]MDQ8935319.1 class I SAM-dependent methyltransferase [Acinetobacter rudis]MDQ8952783.1 class I SAM-dependent methyltransferase [Acinetobacter rudis]MDQ9017486.1 class I SAM-dependent methyltransferase [Acinetobacter rudis]